MAGFPDEFLIDHDPRQWTAPSGAPSTLTPNVFFLGAGDHGLEVALASAARRPRVEDVRQLWQARQGRRPSPLLLIVGYPDRGGERVTVCGPVGEQPPIIGGLEIPQIERLAAASLSEPNRHAAVRFLVAMLPEVGADLPGVRNAGLLATQELRNGVPQRADWREACEESQPLLGLRGKQLVEELGFTVEQLSVNSSVLMITSGPRRAVAVFLDEGETFEDTAARFGTSPVSHALALADREGLPWVVLTRGRQVRLYAARTDTGVGRKGRAETFVELNLALLPDDHAGYLKLLFSPKALADRGTLDEVLDRSADFAAELAVRLRERVYFEAVPGLATAVASQLDRDTTLTESDLAAAYEQTMVILFRLLFLAYAEDKDLLPYRTNSRYADHALKTIARRLAEDRAAKRIAFDSHAIDLWEDVRQLWRAVARGNTGWGVPSYDGGLFSDNPKVNAAGAALARIQLTDAEFGPALLALLVDEGPDGVMGPVDFRSLSVREFGTIYEGLLESSLSVAPSDLSVDTRGNYIPTTRPKDDVVVPAGEIYFHNRSGARKATGSYFTKPFAVEHLLDNALEPTLNEHILRLESLLKKGDEAAAAEAFFDFRCVDLAMGSGHFLVAAVDRIEARLSGFLALHPIAPVVAELERLRQAALTALGDLADGVEIETTSLLRRQVARRCIYGVDLNHIAVELARLGVWIHTFVPGLPLSFLDHGLACGNSLTGIGTLDEAISVLDPDAAKTGNTSLFRAEVEEFLTRAGDALRRLSRVTEATVADVEVARSAHTQALEAVEPARQLFDLLVAGRLGEIVLPVTADETAIASDPGRAVAEHLAQEQQMLHFPVAFPEVFLRDRPGFDAILGNPPWEKLQLEEHGFYSLSFPGLRSLPQNEAARELSRIRSTRPDLVAEYERETNRIQAMKNVLARGPYPGMTAGRPDLYKAFAWRFCQLARTEGTVGVVLPRKIFEASGTKDWRIFALNDFELTDLTMLVNARGWVFDDVHPQWTIGLTSMRHTPGDRLSVRGPFNNMEAYEAGLHRPGLGFAVADLLSWSESASFPLLSSPEDMSVFAKLRAHRALANPTADWQVRGMRELNASDDKEHFVFDSDGKGMWPVYKGESFDLWQPDTGTVYAYAEPDHITEVLQARRRNQVRNRRSSMFGMDASWAAEPSTLPAYHARIAWRDASRSGDSRTMRVALIPPCTVLVHQAYTLFWRRGTPTDEAYALGVLSSIPFDWFARQLVESHVTVEFVNSAPVPQPAKDDPCRRRVEEIAGRLGAADERYEEWAAAVGVPIASVSEEERPDLLAELDAVVSHLYGLDESDIAHVFETFHAGWDYKRRLAGALEHFQKLG